MSVARRYRQELRARQTVANTEAIVGATVALIKRARRVADITLDDVKHCGYVTAQTHLS